jgi:hypothetical protein
MSKPIYYKTTGYDQSGQKINPPITTDELPLPTTGMGLMRKTSFAVGSGEAMDKLRTIQSRDKNFPQTFPGKEVDYTGDNGRITLDIPVKIDVPQAAGRTRARRQRRVSTRRRRASRRKVKRTKHSTKRRR